MYDAQLSSHIWFTHMCSRLCFCLYGWCSLWHFAVSCVCLLAESACPGYSWVLRLVPGAMQERHLASDMLVLIITVHSPGLLFHWHREKGQSFARYSFIPLPCWVSAARCCWVHRTSLHEGSGQLLKLRLVGLQACFVLVFVLPLLSSQAE